MSDPRPMSEDELDQLQRLDQDAISGLLDNGPQDPTFEAYLASKGPEFTSQVAAIKAEVVEDQERIQAILARYVVVLDENAYKCGVEVGKELARQALQAAIRAHADEDNKDALLDHIDLLATPEEEEDGE